MNRIRGGPLILCLVMLVATAMSVTMSLTMTQDNLASPSTAAFAAIHTYPLDAAATSEVVVPGNTVVCSWVSITPSVNFDYDATIAIYNGARLSSSDQQFVNATTGELKHFSRAAPGVGANCASKTYTVCTGDLPSTNNRRGTKLNC